MLPAKSVMRQAARFSALLLPARQLGGRPRIYWHDGRVAESNESLVGVKVSATFHTSKGVIRVYFFHDQAP